MESFLMWPIDMFLRRGRSFRQLISSALTINYQETSHFRKCILGKVSKRQVIPGDISYISLYQHFKCSYIFLTPSSIIIIIISFWKFELMSTIDIFLVIGVCVVIANFSNFGQRTGRSFVEVERRFSWLTSI